MESLLTLRDSRSARFRSVMSRRYAVKAGGSAGIRMMAKLGGEFAAVGPHGGHLDQRRPITVPSPVAWWWAKPWRCRLRSGGGMISSASSRPMASEWR